MKVIRTAVVGLGRIGWGYHLAEVIRHEGFEAAAVVDPLPERREEARSKHGLKAYAQCEELLEAERPELMVIASPTQFHHAQALAAFERGCDVFCDKPVALSLAEADEMIAAAGRHGRKLMVYQPHRANKAVVALRHILAKNLIGPVFMMKRAHAAFKRRDDWQAFRKHGGGMLNNYGAHFIDQMLHLAGFPARRVSCAMRTVCSLGDAEDVVKVLIETAGGMLLDVEINMASAYPMPEFYILGRYGTITLDRAADAWKVRYFLPGELPEVPVQTSLAATDRAYFTDDKIPWREESFLIDGFDRIDFYTKCHEYFAQDKEPFVPMEESREVMRVMEVCRTDAERA